MPTSDEVQIISKNQWRTALTCFLCILAFIGTVVTTWAIAKSTSTREDTIEARVKKTEAFQKRQVEFDEILLDSVLPKDKVQLQKRLEEFLNAQR